METAKQEKNEIEYEVNFEDEYEGTYVVRVTINNREFSVNCQTYLTNSYKESRGLSCSNESGGDISDSGLRLYLEEIGIEDGSEFYIEIVAAIEACAEEHLPENSILRILKDKLCDDTYVYDMSLFGAFGPTDVHHKKYVNDCGEIVVTSEDTSENRAENQLLGYKKFIDQEEYEEWKDKIYDGESYGSCSVSYRAFKDICAEE